MAEKIELHQIYFEDAQKVKLYDFAIPFFNESLTVFFENSVISKVVKQSNADKVGVCSHDLQRKLFIKARGKRTLEQNDLIGDYDVLGLIQMSKHHSMLQSAELWHPGFRKILEILAAKIGFQVPHEVKNPIYQNHFVAKTAIYKAYIDNCLDPAMELMTTDVELIGLCNQDSQYRVTTTGSKARFDRVKELLGLDYYPLHPFVCERLFSIWINDKKLNIQYL